MIDIELVNNKYKIMEFNCLNASGFYESNLYKLINAVENYYENFVQNDISENKLSIKKL